MLSFTVPFGNSEAGAAGTFVPNAFIRIDADRQIVLTMPYVEMGQGTYTAIPMLIAEELEVDLEQVRLEHAPPDEKRYANPLLGVQATGNSNAMRGAWKPLRQAGATARTMLVAAAAKRWNVEPASCRAQDGEVLHEPTGRAAKYGDLAADAARLPVPQNVALKEPRDFKLIGTPAKRLDTPAKVNGTAVYGIDVGPPGMKIATLAQSPVFGGRLKSVDDTAAKAVKGVRQIVRLDDAVAVVADSWWRAKTALEALSVAWDEGKNAKVSSATIADFLKEGLDSDQAIIGNQAGDVQAALAGAAKVVEALYAFPYRIHATMEPMNATALYTSDRCEVWAPTQMAEDSLRAAAQAAGLPLEKCDLHKTFIGGGFGRRGAPTDYVRQAVTVAKAIPGTPIKLLWSREEDTTHDSYHPISQCRMRAALDADNELIGLHMRIAGQSILATVNPTRMQNGKDPLAFQSLNPGGAEGAFGYNVPNLLIDHAMRNPHVPAGFWRGVNSNHNAFYVEGFMDEVAHAVGDDPLAFRLKYLKPKHAAVLKAAAEKAGYDTPAAQGIYRGIAQVMANASYVAACAEVSVDKGRVKVHRVVGATNCGHAVNPEQIARQVEGSFVYGLSSLLYGECTVRDGRIEQTNFDTWEVMRLDAMPKVETVVMPDGEFWGGVGEPTISVAAPAVLNAIFAATGKRIRTIPIKDIDLSAA